MSFSHLSSECECRARPSSTPHGLGSDSGSDTFGRGDVAEADLGRLVTILIGAFAAAAGTSGGRPTSGCRVLGHGKLSWVCVGSGRTDGPGFQPATGSNGRCPPPSRSFQKAARAAGGGGGEGACQAARRWHDVAGCPPRAGWGSCSRELGVYWECWPRPRVEARWGRTLERQTEQPMILKAGVGHPHRPLHCPRPWGPFR